MHDQLQALQRAGVDAVDGGAVQHHVAQRGTYGDLLLDDGLDGAGTCEIGAFVDAQAQDLGHADHIVAADAAEVLGARHLPDHRDMRARGQPPVQQDRHGDARDDARLDPSAEGADDRDRQRREVRACIAPGAAKGAEIARLRIATMIVAARSAIGR